MSTLTDDCHVDMKIALQRNVDLWLDVIIITITMEVNSET